MKLKLLSFLFFLIAVCGFSQTKEIDSLKKYLTKAKLHDTVRINLQLNLSLKYMSIDIDTFKLYNNMAKKLSLKNNKFKLERIYGNVGVAFIYEAEMDSARYYFDKVLNILDKNDDPDIRATIYDNYGITYQNSKNYKKMIEYNSKAIELASNNYYKLSRYQFNQGTIYSFANLPKLSKKYIKLAYKNSLSSGNQRIQGLSLNTLVYLSLQEEEVDSARIYLEKSIELCEKTQSPEICYPATSKTGEFYNTLGDYDKASNFLLKANRYALDLKKPYNIMASNIYLGQNEMKRENYNKAKDYFEQFDKLYAKNSIPILGQIGYRSWTFTEILRGNYKKSGLLLEKYLSITDSISSKENRAVLLEADKKYETEKKDKELAQQNLQLEQQETELQKKKTQYSYMTGVVLVLLIGSILSWLLFQQRQKRKNQEIVTLKREQQVQTLESLMEGEEKERLRIAKELHDGVNVDLSAIKYKLTSLLEKNNEVINEAVTMIDKSCEQVRAISHNLIPPTLKDFSLLETLEDFCTAGNGLHEPEITFNHIGNPITIAKKAEVNIFRIVQELVNNSIKHAKATEISVQISHRDNTIQLTVEDNGVGFDKETITSNGIGLQNVNSRVEYLNANLDFNSGKDGTSYIIDINTDELT